MLARVASRAAELGLTPIDAMPSPLFGPEGNREFLLLMRVAASTDRVSERPSQTLPPDLEDRLREIAEAPA